MAAALTEQARRLEHVLFAGFTHEPAIELAPRRIACVGGQRPPCAASWAGLVAIMRAMRMVAFRLKLGA